ncbi:MAG TPA: NADH-quinone oxidoreductase subunit I [Chloroflexia bacterium]|nr:NADH-quinone oxidoreductase subunit I [Chloroflexia bacterium]
MDLVNQVGGFFVTLRQFFRPTVTVEYPDAMRELAPRFRGAVGLLPHPETGREKCVGCGLCPQVCPVDCISIGVVEDESPDPDVGHMDEWHPFEHYYLKGLDPLDTRSKKMRYYYEINETRCLYCGLCVEVCPVEAIIMSHHFEMATDNRGETIYDKYKLLNLGKTYMAELNVRLDAQARAAGLDGINDMAGANTIGGTTRPTQLGRPAGPEQSGRGAEAYSDEPKET